MVEGEGVEVSTVTVVVVAVVSRVLATGIGNLRLIVVLPSLSSLPLPCLLLSPVMQDWRLEKF
jgi:hypothetical protein